MSPRPAGENVAMTLRSETCGWCGKENLLRLGVPHVRCFFCDRDWSPWPPDDLADDDDFGSRDGAP